MDKNERDSYVDAIQKASVSKAFDRILLIVLSIGLLAVAVYIAIVQTNYQQQSRAITAERNKQLVRILQSNEETKSMIRCAVQSRNTPVESDVEALNQCAKDATVKIPTNIFDQK